MKRRKFTLLMSSPNAMVTEFLVEMRQSNKYGSVMNGEIFNLYLGSDARP